MLTIREFEPNDMFSVIKLASDTLTERYNPSIFNYFFETYNKGFIVADYRHKIIGFLIGVKMNDKTAKILMLAVSRKFRNQKIGSELLNHYINVSKSDKIDNIQLEVRCDNKKAINFYKKHNFKIKDKIKEFYQNGQDAYTMEKKFMF